MRLLRPHSSMPDYSQRLPNPSPLTMIPKCRVVKGHILLDLHVEFDARFLQHLGGCMSEEVAPNNSGLPLSILLSSAFSALLPPGSTVPYQPSNRSDH
jgi:hypothetical protein